MNNENKYCQHKRCTHSTNGVDAVINGSFSLQMAIMPTLCSQHTCLSIWYDNRPGSHIAWKVPKFIFETWINKWDSLRGVT